MTSRQAHTLIAIAIGGISLPAHAQLGTAPIPSALPNVTSISRGNAAGVLQYCVKHELVSSVVAGTVIDGLTKTPEISKSPDFATGEAGQILGSKTFAIGTAPAYLQSQACDIVLKQAEQFK
jgi:hypothetical protein